MDEDRFDCRSRRGRRGAGGMQTCRRCRTASASWSSRAASAPSRSSTRSRPSCSPSSAASASACVPPAAPAGVAARAPAAARPDAAAAATAAGPASSPPPASAGAPPPPPLHACPPYVTSPTSPLATAARMCPMRERTCTPAVCFTPEATVSGHLAVAVGAAMRLSRCQRAGSWTRQGASPSTRAARVARCSSGPSPQRASPRSRSSTCRASSATTPYTLSGGTHAPHGMPPPPRPPPRALISS